MQEFVNRTRTLQAKTANTVFVWRKT